VQYIIQYLLLSYIAGFALFQVSVALFSFG
jgi:hypothetical protein